MRAFNPSRYEHAFDVRLVLSGTVGQIKTFSIITQVIIEILSLSLAENGVIFRYNHLAGGQIFKIAASRFVKYLKRKLS